MRVKINMKNNSRNIYLFDIHSDIPEFSVNKISKIFQPLCFPIYYLLAILYLIHDHTLIRVAFYLPRYLGRDVKSVATKRVVQMFSGAWE
jgi:hypothetical protein